MGTKPTCCESNCYPTKESIKNYEFLVSRLSLKSAIQIQPYPET